MDREDVVTVALWLWKHHILYNWLFKFHKKSCTKMCAKCWLFWEEYGTILSLWECREICCTSWTTIHVPFSLNSIFGVFFFEILKFPSFPFYLAKSLSILWKSGNCCNMQILPQVRAATVEWCPWAEGSFFPVIYLHKVKIAHKPEILLHKARFLIRISTWGPRLNQYIPFSS